MLHVVPLLDDAVFHRVADLQHGAGGSSLVAAHDVLDDHVAVPAAALLLGPQDRSADDGGVLELREVLGRVADLEEAGAAIEDCVTSVLERLTSCGGREGDRAMGTEDGGKGLGRHVWWWWWW